MAAAASYDNMSTTSNKRPVNQDVLDALKNNMNADSAPIVVNLDPNQTKAAPEPPQVKVQPRKPRVPTFQGPQRRATSQHSNKAALNAGRQILSSQGSSSIRNLKEAVPKSNETLPLKKR